jgi:O-methyltransferase
MKKIFTSLKSFLLFLRPGIWLGFLVSPFQLASNTLKLSKWIAAKGKTDFNDFYRPIRNYGLRINLYQHVLTSQNLATEPVDYLEFGVAKGVSFTWWLNHNTHKDSAFHGFDTFEGLPEKWGTFEKGSMSFGVPSLNDERHTFYKGLFQDTLFNFIDSNKLRPGVRKIIHLDADLFSSTVFVLTTLHRYLKPGDILLFDEFNVPNHEFLAFDVYTRSFYVKYEVIGAVNNYFQVAIRIL